MNTTLAVTLGGLLVAGGLTYAILKVLALVKRLAQAETYAITAGAANTELADTVNKQTIALERNRKYARLLENQLIESAGPAELAHVLNRLFKPDPTEGDDDTE